jgi:hypothetical protein
MDLVDGAVQIFEGVFAVVGYYGDSHVWVCGNV